MRIQMQVVLQSAENTGRRTKKKDREGKAAKKGVLQSLLPCGQLELNPI
jgi:hypothetical protein